MNILSWLIGGLLASPGPIYGQDCQKTPCVVFAALAAARPPVYGHGAR